MLTEKNEIMEIQNEIGGVVDIDKEANQPYFTTKTDWFDFELTVLDPSSSSSSSCSPTNFPTNKNLSILAPQLETKQDSSTSSVIGEKIVPLDSEQPELRLEGDSESKPKRIKKNGGGTVLYLSKFFIYQCKSEVMNHWIDGNSKATVQDFSGKIYFRNKCHPTHHQTKKNSANI